MLCMAWLCSGYAFLRSTSTVLRFAVRCPCSTPPTMSMLFRRCAVSSGAGAVLLTSWQGHRNVVLGDSHAVHSHAFPCPWPCCTRPCCAFASPCSGVHSHSRAMCCLASPPPRLALRSLALPLHGTLPARRVRCISRLDYAVASLIGADLCSRWAVENHATPCRCVDSPNGTSLEPCAASRGYTMAVYCNGALISAMPPRCVAWRCIAGASRRYA
jgi:hypothetical protein